MVRSAEVFDRPDLPLLSMSAAYGLRVRPAEGGRAASEDLAGYRVVEPGWLVVNKLSARDGALAVSDLHGIVSPAYWVLRLDERQVWPRFLNFHLRSAPVLAEIRRRSKVMPPAQFDLPWEQFRSLSPKLPTLQEQRRIADFLDDQVARLDAAMLAVAVLRERWEERLESNWASAYDSCTASGTLVTLRRLLTSIVDGPFGSSLTSSHYSDAGCRVIRLGNIGLAKFRPEDAAYISTSYAGQLRQHAATAGDVVMAGLGDDRWPLGRAAVVPDDLGPAIVKADCYRLRPKGGIYGAFLAGALSAPQTRRTILLLARGSTRARLNTEVARDVPVALVDGPTQLRFVGQVQELLAAGDEQARAAGCALALLEERKRALITACVTGEFDVATASSRAAAAALAGAG